MPVVKYDPTKALRSPHFLRQSKSANDEGFFALPAAAFRQENDMQALARMIAAPNFDPDPLFNLAERASTSIAYRIKPDSFLEVASDAEFSFMEAKVMQEFADRQLLAKSGLAGLFWAMVAGVASPTILLPTGIGVRGAGALRAAVRTATWTAVGAAAQETILQSEQELRTTEESVIGVGSAAVMGFILGGAIGHLRGKPEDALAKMIPDDENMTVRPENAPSSLSAAGVPRELQQDWEHGVSGVEAAPSFGLLRLFKFLAPNARSVVQPYSKTLRAFMMKLDPGGIRVKGLSGGSVAARAKVWAGINFLAKEANVVAHRAYRLSGGNLKMADFLDQISLAMEQGSHQDREIMKLAGWYRQVIYNPVLKQLQRVGMLPDDIDLKGRPNYLTFRLKRKALKENYTDLHTIYYENALEQLQKEFQERANRLKKLNARDEQAISDLTLSPEDAAAVRKKLEIEMYSLPDQFPDEIRDIAAEIRGLRADAKATTDMAERKRLNQRAKDLEKTHADTLKPFTKAVRALRRRFSSLDKGRAGLEARVKKILSQIEGVEERQLATLNALTLRARKLLDKIDSLGPEELTRQMRGLENKFLRTVRSLDHLNKKLAALKEKDPFVLSRMGKQLNIEANVHVKETLLKQVDKQFKAAAESRDAARKLTREILDNAIKRANDVNNKRAIRIAKLRERAAKFDPKTVDEVVGRLRGRILDRTATFHERLGKVGGEIVGDAFNFEEAARSIADDIMTKQLSFTGRSPGLTMVGERGSLIARTLNIDPARNDWSNGRSLNEFRELNIEILTREYTKSVGPDFELYKEFGSVNPSNKGSAVMKTIIGEFNEARREAAKKFTGKRLNKELARIEKAERQAFLDVRAVVERIRHMRGHPESPDGLLYRIGRTIMNLNVLRFMGTVVPASLADPARAIMRYGLLTVYRSSFKAFVGGLKNLKATAREVQVAGTALDVMLHTRLTALADVLDDMRYGSMAERAIQTATSYYGRLAGFDYWNQYLKQHAGIVVITSFSEQAEKVFGGKAVSKAAKRRFEAFLQDGSLSLDDARLIWDQMTATPGGANRHAGIYFPNADRWVSYWADKAARARTASERSEAIVMRERGRRAVAAYRSFIVQHTDDTIVTPGASERPLIFDQNLLARMFFQFKSFTFASTFKTLVPIAQNLASGDAVLASRAIIGMVPALALGAMSYYIWAYSAGGRVREEMLNAPIEKWVEEAISRSGLLGVIDLAWNELQTIPSTRPFVTPSGRNLSRSPYNNALVRTLGPSADFADKLLNIRLTMDDPYGANIKSVKRLLPGQNLFYIRAYLDKLLLGEQQ